ncbi:50S ribosomal protein L3 [Candidatus Saccharibacteria bacterium CPR2]|nr:50S ribosomal protein L3 [Candidatus Saccharibacteria bacterium CPR2]
MKAIIGRKLGMSEIIDDKGRFIPVTYIQADPCSVTQIKNMETDGYSALQVGFEKSDKINKPMSGHLKKINAKYKHLKEFRIDASSEESIKVGDSLDVSMFNPGDKVTVSGISKGKGFAGTVKRWNFNTGPKTHGSRNYRKPGSIGSMYPQKIFKGKKMAGQMGSEKTTVKNLDVVIVDSQQQVIGLRGAVPGPRKGLVTIIGN